MILHDWNLADKNADCQGLPRLAGRRRLFAIENIIDDERRQIAFGLMMSLNMLIEFGDAFDFTGAQFADRAKRQGSPGARYPLVGPASAAVAYKYRRMIH